MTEWPKEIEREATRIADEVCGGRPKTCTGWHAKVYNAAWEAAARALPPLVAAVSVDQADLKLARQSAERVLMARLTQVPIEKRDGLRQRIASIRAGLLDSAPEVQSVIDALAEIRKA